MDPVLFLDQDGILANFVTGAIDAHGLAGRIGWWEMDWGFTPFRKFGLPSFGDNPIAFWRPMDQAWWVGLEEMPEAKEIARGVRSIFGGHNIAVLSDPGPNKGAEDGKKEWLRQHFPDLVSTAFFGAAKHLLASPMKVLLDDNDKNVTNFNLYGGCGLLAPRPWNERRAETTEGRFDVGEVLNQLASRRANLVKGK